VTPTDTRLALSSRTGATSGGPATWKIESDPGGSRAAGNPVKLPIESPLFTKKEFVMDRRTFLTGSLGVAGVASVASAATARTDIQHTPWKPSEEIQRFERIVATIVDRLFPRMDSRDCRWIVSHLPYDHFVIVVYLDMVPKDRAMRPFWSMTKVLPADLLIVEQLTDEQIAAELVEMAKRRKWERREMFEVTPVEATEDDTLMYRR
jgi:hypothetical protein